MDRRDLMKLPLAAALRGSPSAAAAHSSRMRLAINAFSFRAALRDKKMTYADLIRLAVDLDVDGLDLTVYWFPSTEDDFLLSLRRDAYLSAVGIYSIAVRAELCQPTANERQAVIEEIGRWVDVAVKLGAGHVRVFAGKLPAGAAPEQGVRWAAETLAKAAEIAGRKGIILGLENDDGLAIRADRTLAIVKAANSPWAGINLDVGNWEGDPYSQIEMCISNAVNVHWKVNIGKGSGARPADWPRIAHLLRQGGYRGYVALEYDGANDPAVDVPKIIPQLKQLLMKA